MRSSPRATRPRTDTEAISVHGSPMVEPQARVECLVDNGVAWSCEELERQGKLAVPFVRLAHTHMGQLNGRRALVDHEAAHSRGKEEGSLKVKRSF